MLDQTISAPQGWTSESVDGSTNWVTDLPTELLEAYRVGSGLDASSELLEAWQSVFAPALEALDKGRGFVLFNRVPVEAWSEDEIRRIYWRVGQSLGIPVEQNIEGTLLYDVRDTGQSVGEGARFSVTNAESSFHTDAAFADKPPEYVGLLNLHSAVSGGESQLVSAYALHDVLRDEASDVLEVLYRDFSFDRRGQFLPSQPKLMVAPVFRWDGRELDTRYLDYYITEGHKQGDPLTESQANALEKVLEAVSRPDMRVEFSLEPGQMLFTNNHWILHNRTAFEDHEDPERRRHYVRLWLERK